MACLQSCWRILVQMPSNTWLISSTNAWKNVKFPTSGKQGISSPYSNQVNQLTKAPAIILFLHSNLQSRSLKLSCSQQWLKPYNLQTTSTVSTKEDRPVQLYKGSLIESTPALTARNLSIGQLVSPLTCPVPSIRSTIQYSWMTSGNYNSMSTLKDSCVPISEADRPM